jgi:hypothetical protein
MLKFPNSIFKSWPDLILVSVFILLSLIGICHHEIWLDEAQHFLLARDSGSLSELIYACRNEGHPLLWNVLLFFITRFSGNVFFMQLFHILISAATVIFICKSKLSLLEKVLVVFGYYFLFEYNLISRNYGLSALFLFWLMHIYQSDKRSVIKMAVIAALLANSHLFALLIALAFSMAYFITERKLIAQLNKRNVLAAVFIVAAGCIISALCIIPPADYANKFLAYESSGYFSSERLIKTFSVCLKGIFYVPDYSSSTNHFENSLYFFTLNLSQWLIYLLSAAAIFLPVFIIRKNRFAVLFFCFFFLLFTAVYYFAPLVFGIRYFGFFYLVFVACYCIARLQVPVYLMRLTQVVFLMQFINGIYAYAMDLNYPFSESKNVYNYTEKIRKKDEKIYFLNLNLRAPVSAYSGKKYFGVEDGTQLSYCHWEKMMDKETLKVNLQQALNRDSTSLVIYNGELNGLLDTSKLEKLKSFDEGIVAGENQTVYRYTR